MKKKIILGVSCGDINGIGIEVFLKAFSEKTLFNICIPVLFVPIKVLEFYNNTQRLKNIKYNNISSICEAVPSKVNLLDVKHKNAYFKDGKYTQNTAVIALDSFNASIDALKKNKIDALVTLPVNKKIISNIDKLFTGHTEHLTTKMNSENSLMLLVSEKMKVATVTNHIPISKVSGVLTRDLLIKKIDILIKSLILDFLISSPRIAVLGLNPHAGDDGLLGLEEKTVLQPVINEYRLAGYNVFGPFAADGFFGSKNYKNYDAVLGMYHDQSLIPFKFSSFGGGVNYTAGLNVIRTSPDHGVAYDIAGKNLADENSFLQAALLAVKIYINRTTSSA